MPVISAETRVMLGILSVGAGVTAGLVGYALLARVVSYVLGRSTAAVGRPIRLWLVFFISASISVVAGSIATFAPIASERPLPTRQAEIRLEAVAQQPQLPETDRQSHSASVSP